MRNERTATTLVIIIVSAALLQATQNHHSPVNGDYVGLQSIRNLSPEEKDTKWFHENRLLIRDNQAILDMVPVFFQHGEKSYSASDGGFLTYRGNFFQKNGQGFVELRLFQSDYVFFEVGRKPYQEIQVYPVNCIGNQIEINGVRYKRTRLRQETQKSLLRLLAQESMNPQ